MTNYENYAGTMDRFADFLLRLDCESGIGDVLTSQFCRGDCHGEDEDADCSEVNAKKCIIAWLSREA